MITTAHHLSPVLNQINPVHAHPSYFLQIHFNIIFPPMLRSSKWFLSFRFSNQNVVDRSSSTFLWQWYKPIIVDWFMGHMSEIKISGTPNCLNYCKTSVVDIQFTNVVVGCIIQPGGPQVGWPRCRPPYIPSLEFVPCAPPNSSSLI